MIKNWFWTGTRAGKWSKCGVCVIFTLDRQDWRKIASVIIRINAIDDDININWSPPQTLLLGTANGVSIYANGSPASPNMHFIVFRSDICRNGEMKINCSHLLLCSSIPRSIDHIELIRKYQCASIDSMPSIITIGNNNVICIPLSFARYPLLPFSPTIPSAISSITSHSICPYFSGPGVFRFSSPRGSSWYD